MVVVAALLNPAWRIEIEMDAVIPELLNHARNPALRTEHSN